MSDTLAPATLPQIVARARDLYSLPAVAMEVLELTNDEVVDANALKQCIENDPALTAKILRVVNSSLFGLSRQVKDLNQALALLGTKPLKLLVLGFSLPPQLFDGASHITLGSYWRLALTKAVAARQISESWWQRPGDDAFLAGLLEDIGILVLLRNIGTSYLDFFEHVRETGCDLCALEVEAIDFHHCQLSAAVLDKWQLPDILVTAIARPKRFGELVHLPADEIYLAQVLHLADLVAQLVAWRRIPVLPELLSVGGQLCGLDKNKLTTLVRDLEEKVAALADVLTVELPAEVSYNQVLEQAHEQLAQTADEVVEDLLGATPSTESMDKVLLVQARELATATRRVTNESVRASDLTSQSDTITTTTATFEAHDHTMLLKQLDRQVSHCRQQRCELSLLLAELDPLDCLTSAHGPTITNQLITALENTARPLAHANVPLVCHDDGRVALVLPGFDRRQAVSLGNLLIDDFSTQVARHVEMLPPLPCVNVGVASVAVIVRNFLSPELLEAAERCLYGAQNASGNSVKSIEL